MRVPIRTSRWAVWARRLASLALPFEIIPVILHHQRVIQSDTFSFLFAIGLLLAVLAILVSLVAFGRLWQSGFRGWGRTVQALLLGLVLIAPLGFAGYWASKYPAANDVATTGTLPELVLAENGNDNRLSAAKTAEAFPTAVARTYALPPKQVFSLLAGLVGEQGWETRLKRDPVPPAYPGRLHAMVTTWLGFRDEVAFLVAWAGEGTVVSMRSASLFGLDDLGANGRRVEAFLAALDQAVLEAQRQGPIMDGLSPADVPDTPATGGDAGN